MNHTSIHISSSRHKTEFQSHFCVPIEGDKANSLSLGSRNMIMLMACTPSLPIQDFFVLLTDCLVSRELDNASLSGL